jgi:hypothetical protein
MFPMFSPDFSGLSAEIVLCQPGIRPTLQAIRGLIPSIPCPNDLSHVIMQVAAKSTSGGSG